MSKEVENWAGMKEKAAKAHTMRGHCMELCTQWEADCAACTQVQSFAARFERGGHHDSFSKTD